MKNTALKVLLILMLSIAAMPASAYQGVKETMILSGYLGDAYSFNKKILKHSYEMQEQADPFTNRRHRARYRFEPSDTHARSIMVLGRKIISRLKLIRGTLYHSEVPNKTLVFRQLMDTADSMITFSKRAIRAIYDNNYALYLASAQGIEKEVFAFNELLASLESAINSSISEENAMHDTL
ncbi:MAG: hypothetical protein ACQETH_07085 [Candidatus Rifleibacteriota bacterium]